MYSWRKKCRVILFFAKTIFFPSTTFREDKIPIFCKVAVMVFVKAFVQYIDFKILFACLVGWLNSSLVEIKKKVTIFKKLLGLMLGLVWILEWHLCGHTCLKANLHIRFLHAFSALCCDFLLLTLIEQNQGKL